MSSSDRPKIRVAFFAEMLIDDFDGAARTMFHIINRIPTSEFEYCFFCGVPPEGDFKHKVVKVPTIKVPKNEDYSMAVPRLAKRELTKKVKDFDPHVIHIATPSMLGSFAVKYGKKHQIPVISIYHTHFISYIDYYFRNIKMLINPVKNLVGRLNKSFYDKCSLVYVPSTAVVEDLKHHNLKTSHFKLWRRGIDTVLFHPQKRNEQLVKTYHDQGEKVILFASRLVWEKNLQLLIDIYKKIKEQNHPYRLVIAGDGVARKKCEQEMPEAVFLGMLDHDLLASWYASADLFLFTSDTETYGNVVVEAMASGVPVVVADAGGPSDIVSQGKTGVKCNPHDADEFVEQIDSLLKGGDSTQTLVDNALAYANSLSWKALVAEYFDDVKTLAAKQK